MNERGRQAQDQALAASPLSRSVLVAEQLFLFFDYLTRFHMGEAYANRKDALDEPMRIIMKLCSAFFRTISFRIRLVAHRGSGRHLFAGFANLSFEDFFRGACVLFPFPSRPRG